MKDAGSFYFDRVSQIRMNRWTKSRAALVGVAAACVSLVAAEGTGLAMAEAYVLAGELHHCAGDHSGQFFKALSPDVWCEPVRNAWNQICSDKDLPRLFNR